LCCGTAKGWATPVFVLWQASGSHMIGRNDSIMPNHFVKKWALIFKANIKEKRQNKKKKSVTLFQIILKPDTVLYETTFFLHKKQS
jgi:hypothetical protein